MVPLGPGEGGHGPGPVKCPEPPGGPRGRPSQDLAGTALPDLRDLRKGRADQQERFAGRFFKKGAILREYFVYFGQSQTHLFSASPSFPGFIRSDQPAEIFVPRSMVCPPGPRRAEQTAHHNLCGGKGDANAH